MKKISLILALSILILPSCVDPMVCCVVVDTDLEIAISDSYENDLLDRNNPEAFKEEHIRLFRVENGEKVEVVHSTSKTFFVFEDPENDRFVIRVFLGGDDPIVETIIEWSNKESDTFLAEIEKFDNGNLLLRKVWYENNLVFDTKTSTTGAFIELKK